MRTWHTRLSFVVAAALVLTAVVQATASSDANVQLGPPLRAAAGDIGSMRSLDDLRHAETERLELRRQMEEALAAFDVASLDLEKQAAHPRLDSMLNQIVARAGTRSKETAAADAPVHLGPAVGVSIHISGDADGIQAWLAAHGATIANVAPDIIEAYVPVDQLVALSERPGVLAVRAIIPAEPMVTSQGVAIHGAPNWHANGYTGAGVKVGIIDTGFEGYTALIGSELPSPVAVRCYTQMGQYSSNLSACENGEPHGTAVAEAVIDVAPGATLYLGVPISEGDLQATAQWMVAQGVQVINHSVGWLWDGPGDGTSPYSISPLKTVDAAVAAGITWVNAAGNSALDTWHGPFTDSNTNGLLEFSPGIDFNGFLAEAGIPVVMQVRWNDTWAAASIDLNIAVLNSASDIVAFSSNPQRGISGQIPLEFVAFVPSSTDIFFFVVLHVSGSQPGWVEVQTFSGQDLAYSTTNYSITNPAESANPGLLAVGATGWDNTTAIENYSSQGPTTDGRIKPDIVGVARGDSATYGPNGFAGTSQASPHVAGLAALVKQRFPNYTPAQVADYLKSNAQPRGNGRPNNTWGWGLAYLPQITVSQPTPTPTSTQVSSNPFDEVWRTTDAAVANGSASYSWFWGPTVNYETYEPYQESPGGQRQVRYYDKSRMEINDPNGDRSSIWYVTNGLLTVELVTGRMKMGNASDQQRAPSTQLVAGDPQNNPGTPSYAMFQPLVTTDGASNRAPDRTGQEVTAFLSGNGFVGSTDSGGVRLASYQAATGHNIPDVFWWWMNDPASGFRPQQGVDWLFVLGYPISEPYWIDATVGGQVRRVLVQLYERRVLTYTPSNPRQYQVEFGNIGQHYHWWRYSSPSTPTPTATATEPGGDWPREGAVIFQPDMSQWESWTSPTGQERAYWDPATSSYVMETSYPATADDPGMIYTWWESWNGPVDYSITVDIVTLNYDTSANTEVGVRYRLESSGETIQDLAETTIAMDGRVSSWYISRDDADLMAGYTETPAFNAGFGAVNRLKVIVKENHAWVFLNGVLVQEVSLDARLSPSANGFGMIVWRFGPNSQPVTKFGFRNLVIREVD